MENLETRITIVENLSNIPAPVRTEGVDPAITAQLYQKISKLETLLSSETLKLATMGTKIEKKETEIELFG